MSDYDIHALTPADFDDLMQLEQTLFGCKGEKTLGAFYVRLCCDFYGDTSFIARADGGKPIGYILSFVRDREAYCSTLAIIPEFQRTRAVHYLIQAFIRAIAYRVDVLWFTVEAGNAEARALHATLGAHEIEVKDSYFGQGEPRIISRIERPAFDKLRSRMERLGLLERPAPAPAPAAAFPRAGVAS
jgi:ribosomal protein S18 acetylase RimI-like enzyme